MIKILGNERIIDCEECGYFLQYEKEDEKKIGTEILYSRIYAKKILICPCCLNEIDLGLEFEKELEEE